MPHCCIFVPLYADSEVEEAVKQMRLGKAAGLDRVPGEVIRNAGPSSMRAQHTLHKNNGKRRMAINVEKP